MATASAACRSANPASEMLPALAAALAELPVDRPRYLMGVGDPVTLLDAVALGVDMFDCVLPTRLARHGTALTSAGRYQVRAARHAADDGSRSTPPAPAGSAPASAGATSATCWWSASRPAAACSPSTTCPGCSALVARARDAIRDRHPGRPASRGGCPLGTGVAALRSPGRFRGEAPPLSPCTPLSTSSPPPYIDDDSFVQEVVELDLHVADHHRVVRRRSTCSSSGPGSSALRQQQTAGPAAVRRRRSGHRRRHLGPVVALDSDVAEVEVAPGVVLTFLRRAVSAPA